MCAPLAPYPHPAKMRSAMSVQLLFLPSAAPATPKPLRRPKISPICRGAISLSPSSSSSSFSRTSPQIRTLRCEAAREGSQPQKFGEDQTIYKGIYGPWTVDSADVRELSAADCVFFSLIDWISISFSDASEFDSVGVLIISDRSPIWSLSDRAWLPFDPGKLISTIHRICESRGSARKGDGRWVSGVELRQAAYGFSLWANDGRGVTTRWFAGSGDGFSRAVLVVTGYKSSDGFPAEDNGFPTWSCGKQLMVFPHGRTMAEA
ncbi:hypothetical protein ACLOJK_019507 [Asimina triloba]